MKSKIVVMLIFLLISGFACSLFSSSNSDIPLSVPTECNLNEWKIAITSIEQKKLENDTKLVVARISIENNDKLWGSVSGPSSFSEGQDSVFLQTEDGSTYNYLTGYLPIPSDQLPNQNQFTNESTGWIATVPLPPGFVTSGQTIQGKPYYFNFAFEIPSSQKPVSITISGMEIKCILPHTIQGGKASYSVKRYPLPEKNYSLASDIRDIHGEPPINRFPYLVGKKLEMPDNEGVIEFTDISRKGELIVVTFNFTNLLSSENSPSFNGYIIGEKRLFSCQSSGENDCEHQSIYMPVPSGQTIQGLKWSFTVPEDETDLMLVYIYGDEVDVNDVYRITP